MHKKLYFVNFVNYKIYMDKTNKNKTYQITEEEFNQHKSRTIYLRDDYCDWGSSGVSQYDIEQNQENN